MHNHIHKDTVALILWSVLMLVLYLSPGPHYWAEVLSERAQMILDESCVQEAAPLPDAGHPQTDRVMKDEPMGKGEAGLASTEGMPASEISGQTSVVEGEESGTSHFLDAALSGMNQEPEATNVAEKAVMDAARSIVTDNLNTKERLAHGLPMAGFAFCLARLLRRRRSEDAGSQVADDGVVRAVKAIDRIALILLAVAAVAGSIEGLQELLPEWFHRGFAWDDIRYSLAGGLCGAIGGSVKRGR